MDFSKVKSALATTGNGLLLAGSVLHNAPIHSRIAEIEEEIEKLQEEKAELEAKLLSR